MAELLLSFEHPVRSDTGTYHARAIGRRAPDGMWEGWLEFVPADSDQPVVVGSVESRQPERTHLVYWATGLSPVFLEGALRRALKPMEVRVRVAETPASTEPAPRMRPVASGQSAPMAVLDPFDVGGRSLDILRQELMALNRARLLNIIDAHELNPGSEDVDWMSHSQLAHFIVIAVDTRLAQARAK
jgi:hypothetical protein